MGQSQLEFEAFYAAAKDDCLRTVFACTGDLHRAEDLVAEAFARAWASFGNWMFSHHLLTHDPNAELPPFTNEFLPGQGI